MAEVDGGDASGGRDAGEQEGGADPGATLARLVYAYKIAPADILKTPGYLLRALVENLDAVEAHAIQQAITSTIAPQMKKGDYQHLQRDLKSRMRPLLGTQKPQRMEVIRYDPQAAAEWLRSQGIDVIETTESA